MANMRLNHFILLSIDKRIYFKWKYNFFDDSLNNLKHFSFLNYIIF